MTISCNRWWGSVSDDLLSIEYPFRRYCYWVLRWLVVLVKVPSMGQFDGFQKNNRIRLHAPVANKNSKKATTQCRYKRIMNAISLPQVKKWTQMGWYAVKTNQLFIDVYWVGLNIQNEKYLKLVIPVNERWITYTIFSDNYTVII